jgi:hypothetical protein
METSKEQTVKDLGNRIAQAVSLVRSSYVVISVLALLGTSLWAPLWWLLVLVPVLWVGYYGCLVLTGIYIGATTSQEEWDAVKEAEGIEDFNKIVASGELDADNPDHVEAAKRAGVQLATVVSVSEEIACRYMDNEIPEWIDIKTTNGVNRCHFDSIAETDPQTGACVLPEEEGYIVFKDAVFKKSSST